MLAGSACNKTNADSNDDTTSFHSNHLVWAAQIVALLLPFFNDIVALLGAIGFAPLTVFFPVTSRSSHAVTCLPF
jgi:hypothetical protein